MVKVVLIAEMYTVLALQSMQVLCATGKDPEGPALWTQRPGERGIVAAAI
jgi:hypothetical protein